MKAENSSDSMSFLTSLRLAARFALREMRGGLSGFYIFLACVALGVAAIGGVNSVARAVGDGIAAQGQIILGGDLSFSLQQREVTADERAFLSDKGPLAESVTMRSMLRTSDGSDQALVEVKAVDDQYPLYGQLETMPPLAPETLFDAEGDIFGAAASQLLMDRMGLKVGDEVLLGTGRFVIRAVIDKEPDLLSDGLMLAPRFMVSLDGLQATGLVQPGSLSTHIYKLRLAPDMTQQDVLTLQDNARSSFPDAGWNIRTRANAAPSLTTNIERFSQFLTLVGLTALVVGGVGVANAVHAYLGSKRNVIATFKALGASARFSVMVYLLQIIFIAMIGIVIGLACALLIPFIALGLLQDYLPVSEAIAIYPSALLMAALFGLLTVVGFALLPLGIARHIPPTALFRAHGYGQSVRAPMFYMAMAALFLATLAGLAFIMAYDRRIAAIFIVAMIAAFIVLRMMAAGIVRLARLLPRSRFPAMRLAVGNIYRPGALTASIVLSLGLGLTLMVALATIDGNLRRQVTENIPAQTPDFFFVDIQNRDVDGFSSLIAAQTAQGKLTMAPMLRGRITAFNGQDIRNMNIPAAGAWVLRGDRGVTFSSKLPENSTLVEGEWWPEDYTGEPLVSFAAQEARDLGLKIGDLVTVNVMGRAITARIASLRQVEWETLAMNFVMVFSPNTFAGAPVNWLATLTLPESQKALYGQILRSVTQAYPTVTSVGVRDAIDVANTLIGQLTVAIRAAASIALIASLLVLGGALAAGNNARLYDAVVLKTLGASRALLMRSYILEYLLLGAATALFALFAGTAAGLYVVVGVMRLKALILPDIIAATLIAGAVMTIVLGLIGTWRVLGRKPAGVLREL